MPLSIIDRGWNSFPRYHTIRHCPSSEQHDEHEKEFKPIFGRYSTPLWLTAGVVSVVTLIAFTAKHVLNCDTTPSIISRSPAIRQEWRSLAAEEKHDYIAAVQCMRSIPSKIGLNQSLYDDFPWVHSQVGEYSHESAAFLVWHRWFIYTYEKTLKDECDYNGELPYWDWTLDWQDITRAPVWDDFVGFGHSGEPNSNSSLLQGTCVTSGPFANLEVLYVKGKELRHCLSRGFLEPEGSKMKELSQWIRPSMIQNILDEPRYEDFNLRLEENSHVAIPRMIQGDFLLLTAPYDPVFFLHHAQLDRLWFHWQQIEKGRTWQYMGSAAHNTTECASLRDLVPMGGLAPEIEVSRLMDTRGETLGYMYL